jgi:hypothetical protein
LDVGASVSDNRKQKRKQKQTRRAARQDVAPRKPDAGIHADQPERARLLIHRDAQGRTHLVTLSQPLFNESWQNNVATATANTALALLGEAQTVDKAVELAQSAMAGTSKIAEGALRLSPGRQVACQSGCSHCCHQAVGVSAPEVFAIYRHLQATRTPGQLESAAERIREADDKTRGMTASDRLSPALPCPFLESDRCSIYEVRPLACRGTNSLDAAACDRALRDPETRAAFLAGTFPVPCFLEPIRAFHAVAAGMQVALHELHGLQMLPLELTAAMRIMVDQPETVPARWLAGEDPFQPARGGDTTDDPRIRELSGRTVDRDQS